MPDRLTTQLDDGSLEHLRELAGGERKVGAFLSGVVAWLWQNKAQLEDAPLADYALTATTFAGRIRETLGEQPIEWDDGQAEVRQLQALLAEYEGTLEVYLGLIEDIAPRLAELEASDSRIMQALERLTQDTPAVRIGQLQSG